MTASPFGNSEPRHSAGALLLLPRWQWNVASFRFGMGVGNVLKPNRLWCLVRALSRVMTLISVEWLMFCRPTMWTPPRKLLTMVAWPLASTNRSSGTKWIGRSDLGRLIGRGCW